MGHIKDFFLGIDKEKYAKIHSEVEKANRRELLVFSVLAAVVLGLLGIIAFVSNNETEFITLYFSFVVVFAFIFGLTFFTKETNSSVINITCILYNLMLLVFGMLIGELDAEDKASTVYIVLLLATSLLFTMRPIYTNLLAVIMTTVFIVVESTIKIHEVFYLDAINAGSFCVISLFICSFMMRTKLSRFIAEYEKTELMEYIRQDAITDEMTGIGNRNLYEQNFAKYPVVPKGRDFVYVSIDLNGLKVANDTYGHEAGDELIKGCAQCMKEAFSKYGNIYRIGGDEFVAILFVDNELFKEVISNFEKAVDDWQGKLVDSMSVAIGSASISDYPDSTVDELSKISDKLMYADKGRYYKAKGVDRRGRQEAHVALCNLYTKILKVDLKEDIYQIINVDPSEQTEDKGFDATISGWFTNFANKGLVHPDDKDEFIKKTSLDYIKNYFADGKLSLGIFYRRRIGDEFKQVMMEIIPCDTYSEYNQTVFLYVKNIDRV